MTEEGDAVWRREEGTIWAIMERRNSGRRSTLRIGGWEPSNNKNDEKKDMLPGVGSLSPKRVSPRNKRGRVYLEEGPRRTVSQNIGGFCVSIRKGLSETPSTYREGRS